jgi:hypothetical protein
MPFASMKLLISRSVIYINKAKSYSYIGPLDPDAFSMIRLERCRAAHRIAQAAAQTLATVTHAAQPASHGDPLESEH